ncbi:coiled-coil domain-containing protein 158 isoform X2 [Anolis sagrei]|uniref:coiled-coil domain-containing protein 158 isoform X2 n=1 Tax=Anolis sagrei TaxID=38937 RepID=UPI00352017F3
MSKSLQELREALQKQTQETLKLQEEANKFSKECVSRRQTASYPCNIISGGSVPLARNSGLQPSIMQSEIIASSGPFASNATLQPSVMQSEIIASSGPFASNATLQPSVMQSEIIASSGPFASNATLQPSVMQSEIIASSGPFASNATLQPSVMQSEIIASSGPFASNATLQPSIMQSEIIASSGPFASNATLQPSVMQSEIIAISGPFASNATLQPSIIQSEIIHSTGPFASNATLQPSIIQSEMVVSSGPLANSTTLQPSTMHSGMVESSDPLASSTTPQPSIMRSGMVESSGPLASNTTLQSSKMRNGMVESSGPLASNTTLQSSKMRSGMVESSGPLASNTTLQSSKMRSGMVESSGPLASNTTLQSSKMRSGMVESSGPLASNISLQPSFMRSGMIDSSVPLASNTVLQPSMVQSGTAEQPAITRSKTIESSGPFANNIQFQSSIMQSGPVESSVYSGPSSAGGSPTKTLYSNYELDVESQRKPSKYSERDTLLEEYSQQVKDLQKRLSETTEQHEQQKLGLRQSILELQASLQQVAREKEMIADIRRKESQTQEDLSCQMKATISELETASQLKEEMLKESSSQTEHLRMMVQGHENVFRELRQILIKYEEDMGKKVYEHESVTNLHICNLPTAFGKVLRDLEAEVLRLQGRLASLEEQQELLKKESQCKIEMVLQDHHESIERLISEHEQELEALSENANASRSHASSIQSQLEIVQEQAKNQNSLYMRQVNQLESTVSQLRSELRETRRMSQDKIEELEKELHLVNSEIAEAQSERDQYSLETGNLDDQVQLLRSELHKKDMELNLEKEQNKRLWDRDTGSSITIDHLRRELDNKNMELQRMDASMKSMKAESQEQMDRQMSAIKEKNESIEKVASMTAQQESTKETLRKVSEELAEKKISLEAAERQVAELTSSVQEKESMIEVTNEEIQKLRGRVDGKLQELQQLKTESEHLLGVQSECDSLKLQLVEKEKVVEILRKQIENMTQVIGQHSRTAGALELEKSQLLKEANDKKLEIHELKILQDKKDCQLRDLEASLSEMELEKVKLMNANAERLRVLKEMKLEREELINEIKISRIEFATLVEESEVIKSDFQERSEEMETTVNKLKLQLKSAQFELEQTRATLKNMEGSDGHAMKVAMGMQKQITAKRGQIEALQSKIKFLEEAMTTATKEKHYLKEERNKLSQELTCMAASNIKMAEELDILKSQDKRLKEKLATMESALDKASMQFAECQCIMQQQEQEAMRFKLQHTLDVKELQGPGYILGSSSAKQRHCTLPHSHPSSAPTSQGFADHVSLLASQSVLTTENPLRDLKQVLQELRSTVEEMPSANLPRRESDSDTDSITEGAINILDVSNRECIGRRIRELYSREAAVRDIPTDVTRGQDAFSREPSTLHAADLEDPTLSLPSSTTQAIFSSTPRCTSSKKPSPEERYKARSPVYSLLTAPLDDLKASSAPSLERRSSLKKSCSPEASASAASKNSSFSTGSSMQAREANGKACRKLQNKMESLQNLVETLQLKNQAMSTMIRCQEKKIEKAKEKEKKLSK